MGVDKTLKSAEGIFLALLVLGLIGLLFLIIYGNLAGNLGFVDDTTTITNESVEIGATTGNGVIADATNVNFVSWNATTILNATDYGEYWLNNTLEEGTDYVLFTNNGTFNNITGDWNGTLITYTVTRESQGETNTDAVIDNLTGGATQFFEFADVWFILTAITILIGIVLGVIALVRRTGGAGFGDKGKRARTEFTT